MLHTVLGTNPASTTEPPSPDQLAIFRIIKELNIEKEIMGTVNEQIDIINK